MQIGIPRVNAIALLVACLSTVCLSACAVQQQPAPLQLAAQDELKQRSLLSAVEFQLSTGYQRTLLAGSQWRLVGQLAQGEVYRPVGDVFTVEGAHIHEAYLVVNKTSLVGFYLPAERTFSPIPAPLSLPFNP